MRIDIVNSHANIYITVKYEIFGLYMNHHGTWVVNLASLFDKKKIHQIFASLTLRTTYKLLAFQNPTLWRFRMYYIYMYATSNTSTYVHFFFFWWILRMCIDLCYDYIFTFYIIKLRFNWKWRQPNLLWIKVLVIGPFCVFCKNQHVRQCWIWACLQPIWVRLWISPLRSMSCLKAIHNAQVTIHSPINNKITKKPFFLLNFF